MRTALPFAGFVIVTLLSGSGCSRREVQRDVDYYIANPEERAAMLEDCAADVAEAEERPNCTNAASAKFRSNFQNKSMSGIK